MSWLLDDEVPSLGNELSRKHVVHTRRTIVPDDTVLQYGNRLMVAGTGLLDNKYIAGTMHLVHNACRAPRGAGKKLEML